MVFVDWWPPEQMSLRIEKCAAHLCLWGTIHEIKSENFLQAGSILSIYIFSRVNITQIAPVTLLTCRASSAKTLASDLMRSTTYEVASYMKMLSPRAGTHGMASCPIRNTCLGRAPWIIAFADMKFAPRNKQSIHVPAATVRVCAWRHVPCAFLTPHLCPVQPPLGERAQPQNGDGLPCQRTAPPSHSVLSP